VSRSADAAITRRAFRQVWIGAVVWAAVFGLTAASSALTYASSFPDVASRARLAATTGTDRGLAMLLGPVAAIGTVGGYTVYKGFAFITTIAAVWGLLITTRVLRGEEDRGRWQLVLANGTRAGRATLATLVALFMAVGIVFAGTTVITYAAGRSPKLDFGAGPTLLYGLGIAAVAAVFVGVGALTSQLGRSRRVATGLGMGMLGAAFVVRMIADSGPSTHWLLWFTPFGWIERTRPYTENDVRPLALAFIAVVLLVVVAVRLASTRDAGDGAIASRDVAKLRPRGLRSPTRLALRLDLPVLIAWFVGAVVAAFAFGTIAKVATGIVSDSVSDTLHKFGVSGSDFVLQYFGVAFLFFATIVALLPVAEIGSAADDEQSGRLVPTLALPVRRATLLAGRLALATAAIVVTAIGVGIAAWLGAASQGVHLDFGRLVGAGLNVVPTALLVLGFGALAVALVPRAATVVVYGVVVASLTVDLVSSLVDGLHWLGNASVFHYMALAPSQAVDATTVVVTLVIATALCALAIAGFARRDIRV
jgi:ABC-2 type transport system permease protein